MDPRTAQGVGRMFPGTLRGEARVAQTFDPVKRPPPPTGCRLQFMGFDAVQGANSVTIDEANFPGADAFYYFVLATPNTSNIGIDGNTPAFINSLTDAFSAVLASTGGTHVIQPTDLSACYLLVVAVGYKCCEGSTVIPNAATNSGSSHVQCSALTTADFLPLDEIVPADYLAAAVFYGNSAASSSSPDSPLSSIATLTHNDGTNYWVLSVAHRPGLGSGSHGPYFFTTDFPAPSGVRGGMGLLIPTHKP